MYVVVWVRGAKATKPYLVSIYIVNCIIICLL